MNNETLLIVFVAMTGLALATQAAVLLAFFFFAKKSYDKMRHDFDELRESALPFLAASREALTRISPHIGPITTDIVSSVSSLRTISADVADITAKVRVQVNDAQATTTAIVGNVKRQAVRVDSMTTRALDSIDRAGSFLQNIFGSPARQLAGVLSATKAVVDSMRRSGPEIRPDTRHAPATNDSETFV